MMQGLSPLLSSYNCCIFDSYVCIFHHRTIIGYYSVQGLHACTNIYIDLIV